MAPAPDLAASRHLDFQRRLADEKVDFNEASTKGGQAIFRRQGPVNLKVQVGPIQGNQPVGQLLIIGSADPQSASVEAGVSPEIFVSEAEAVTDIFEELWPERRQIVARDATLRLLYDSGTDHAFQFLWEHRFGQAGQTLNAIGRPVLGGGLRLVMPPVSGESEDFTEVKIESFLQDPSKIFIETSIKWPKPIAEGIMQPDGMVQALETFTEEKVIPFLAA